jgi:UDP-2,3-diacylglucosamine pyrophosphatase LpxH
MSQRQNVVISDIHMGTNVPTNWYQQSIHEPYLINILQYVISNRSEIDELIILGDLFDFWTYPPDMKPPSANDIIVANPAILGPGGLISQVLDALNGNVSYVRGNHDITTTQDDLNGIGNSVHKVILQPDIYLKDGVIYTHGNLFTMFNAPDISTNPPQPIPAGHFVTRAISYMLQQKGESASGESGFGASNMGYGGLSGLLNDGWEGIEYASLVDELLTDIQNTTNISDDQEIILERNLGSITFGQAKLIYKNLASAWFDKYNHGEGDLRGGMYVYKAVFADYDGSYLGWFAQQLAFEYNANLVVMGHTHIPKAGLEGDIANYINSGFECVPTPDMQSSKMTFSVVTTEDGALISSEVMAITMQGSQFLFNNDNPPKASVLGSASSDYSCYVTVQNNSTEQYNLIPSSIKNNSGYFVSTLPSVLPQVILPGQSINIWIQDSPGLEGSDGSVSYTGQNSGKLINLSFSCPLNKVIYNNECAGTDEFYCKSNDVHNSWGAKNSVPKYGNPFFVKFVID